MSNIIILAGSERKDGNTDMLVDAFKKGAVEKNKVEVISVRSHDITPALAAIHALPDREMNVFKRMICRLYMKN